MTRILSIIAVIGVLAFSGAVLAMGIMDRWSPDPTQEDQRTTD